jgi:hypothetical protein
MGIQYFINELKTNTGLVALLSVLVTSILTNQAVKISKEYELKKDNLNYKRQVYAELFDALAHAINSTRDWHDKNDEDTKEKYDFALNQLLKSHYSKYCLFMSKEVSKKLLDYYEILREFKPENDISKELPNYLEYLPNNNQLKEIKRLMNKDFGVNE